jgi:hypothetical protein
MKGKEQSCFAGAGRQLKRFAAAAIGDGLCHHRKASFRRSEMTPA